MSTRDVQLTFKGKGSGPTTERAFSLEIQGLRAIAVLAVLVFHIWPTSLSGGFVGVDVFFVISGYLITGGLLRELNATGRVSLGRFYQRRIKRLLPAATVTLLGVSFAYTLLPVASWANSAKATAASTLYVQNWWLAHRATDYWAQGDAVGPLQHFWSLSVEEQFYFGWPLLFLLIALVARKLGRSPASAIGIPVAVLGITSLVYCAVTTRSNPEQAYFATTTRAWELALGGALAIYWLPAKRSEIVSQSLAALGLVMIVFSCFAFSEGTLFPGYAALLPTLGAVAIIAAGTSSSALSVSRLLRAPICQYFGDLSYSLYLWHWPVLIFYRQLSGRNIGFVDGMLIFLVSCALAQQSKILVEDTFRKPGILDRKRWHTFGVGALCMAVTLGAAWHVHTAYLHIMEEAKLAAANEPSVSKLASLGEKDRIIAALRAKEDFAPWYQSKTCRGFRDTSMPVACTYGDQESEFSVVLIGDSHAVHWEPAFIGLAEREGVKFSLFAKTACAVGDHPTAIGKERVLYGSCDVYRNALMDILLASKPQLVVIAQSRKHTPFGIADKEKYASTVAEALGRTVDRLEAAGIKVVLLADTPWFTRSGPECLSDSRYVEGSCDLAASTALSSNDPALLLKETRPATQLITMNSQICDQGVCRVLIDDMIAFRDAHHLTAGFSRSLASKLREALADHLPAAR